MYDNIVSFIRELYNKPQGVLGLHEPLFIGNEKKYVVDAIDSPVDFRKNSTAL